MVDNRLNILIESKIPFIKGVLEPYADVRYLPPEQIDATAIKDTDVLITRTRTHCDAALLDGSRCRVIATATIGTDHIDLDYCSKRGIAVYNAPGCNAPGVAQYVFASIISVLGKDLAEKKLGVVGVGNVGSIVARWGRQLGMDVLMCDPPRAEAEGSDEFVDIERIYAEADVITFHTPYTTGGAHPTHHLFSQSSLEKLAQRPMIINSARGPVTDTQALIRGLDEGHISHIAIDCWEQEPKISAELLAKADVATPHIAGYSREGKIRATHMAVDAVTRHLGLPAISWSEDIPAGAAEGVTVEAIAESYDPKIDTQALRLAPESFEKLRNDYHLRDEVRQKP